MNAESRFVSCDLRHFHAPAPLHNLKGWLVWGFESHSGEPKPRKVPYYVEGGRRFGIQGSLQDRSELTTFEHASLAASKLRSAGVGFALMPEFGIIALDFDDCVVDRKVDPVVYDLVKGTYAEYSPSGKGVRAFFRGPPDLLENRKSAKSEGQFGFEVFSSKGFVTVTGDMLDHVALIGWDNEVADIPEHVVEFARSRFTLRNGPPLDPADFMIGHEPKLGLTIERIAKELSELDPDMPREPWRNIGFAVHHECEGDDTGFDLWDEWSSGGSKYPGTEALRSQWESFDRRVGGGHRQITMATVIKMVKDRNYAANPAAKAVPSISAARKPITATPYTWRDPASIPKRPWLFGRWLLRDTVACVVAPGGVGKSTFTGAMAISFATGKNLLGKEVWGGPKKVWTWNLEDTLDELSRTLQATCQHYAIKDEDIADRLFVDSGMEGATLCTATEDRHETFIDEQIFDEVAEEVGRRGIEVLIIDPFVSSHAVEENSNSKIDKIAKAWGRVAKRAGCVVILVHHTSKAGSVEVSSNSARGASALISAARSVLTLNRMTKDDAHKYGISEEMRRRHFAVIDDKHNRAPAEADAWYELVSIELDNGDKVAVCAPWTPPVLELKMEPADIKALQAMVDEGSYRDHSQAREWVGKAIAEVLDLNVNDASHRARIVATQKELKAEKYLTVYRQKDKKGKEVPYIACGRRAHLNGD